MQESRHGNLMIKWNHLLHRNHESFIIKLGILAAYLNIIYPLLAGTYVQFRTTKGDMEVELYDEFKPNTVRNFLKYVQTGAYENLFFHRCIPGFVIQGGGFAIMDPTSHDSFTQYWNVPNYGNISNEFNAGRILSNVYGTIAMAKQANNPDSASSQWFFNLVNNSAWLDKDNGGFTVFGKVIRGTNVLELFNQMQLNGGGVVDLTQWYGSSATLFSTLPVIYNGITPPTYADLIYVDITTLSVVVSVQIDGTRDISWNSVSNKVNTVEYTTNFPPVWQTHKTIQGTGQRLTVTDPTRTDKKRFYRVRVDY